MKKRRGNLVVVVVIFFSLTLLFGAALSASNFTKDLAYTRAMKAGSVNSYITLANLCANEFKTALEDRQIKMALYGVGHIDSIDPDIYNDALEYLQNGIPSEPTSIRMSGGDAADGGWYYEITDPEVFMANAGILDEDVLTYLSTFISDVTVEIYVHDDLGFAMSADDIQVYTTGDTITIAPIYFEVQFIKGRTCITQTYCLSDERLTAKYDSVYATITIDDARSALTMTEQNVTTEYVQENDS